LQAVCRCVSQLYAEMEKSQEPIIRDFLELDELKLEV
jgi:hypothetical protein